MFKIAIPQPCHENWQKMTPTAKGAFCKACAKEVVDFTKMTDEQVQNYLLERTHEKLCGRFQPQQLSRIELYIPAVVFTQNIASWKKYLAIVLLAFGTMLVGCDVKTDKSVAGEHVFTTGNSRDNTIVDSAYATVGGMLVPPTQNIQMICPSMIVGDVSIKPDTAYTIEGEMQLIEQDSVAIPDTEEITEVETGFIQSQYFNDSPAFINEYVYGAPIPLQVEEPSTNATKSDSLDSIFTGKIQVADKTNQMKMVGKGKDSSLLKNNSDSNSCGKENYW